MPFSAIFALLATTLVSEAVDRQQLARLIEGAQQANYQDVRFDYEGRWEITPTPGPQQVRQAYTGTFIHRRDGSTFVDIYNFDRNDRKATHGLIAILDGATTSSTQAADQPRASIKVRKQGPLEYAGPSSFREIWLIDQVKTLINSDYLYEFENFQMLDTEVCAVARFHLSYDEKAPKNQVPSIRFWIDLRRGGHVLRKELRTPGDKLADLTTVRLDRYEIKPDRQVWLPTSGRLEGFVSAGKDRQPVFQTQPTTFRTYELLRSSLRIDQNLRDDAFTVQPRSGDVVSDQIRQARFEFGQYLVRPKTVTRAPTDTEIKAEVDRMLGDSERMARELRATTPAREASVWSWAWRWAVAGGALLGLGFLVLRQRRG